MKRYQSHKIVEAAKITAAEKNEKGEWKIALADAGPSIITLDGETSARFRITEEDLGYYVRYPDGYVSWSPTDAFESGYSVIDNAEQTG